MRVLSSGKPLALEKLGLNDHDLKCLTDMKLWLEREVTALAVEKNNAWQ